jgi:putative transposase
MAIKEELLKELLAGRDPQEVFKPDGVLDELKKALAERVLNAEVDHQLAEEKAGDAAEGRNHRNGYSRKTVLTESGALELSIPRDRQGRFEPQLIAKCQRRFPGFDAKLISLYARGMTLREIQGHLYELYGMEVSAELVSAVTDAVMVEVEVWQSRPLESFYPVLFFDALRVKIRDEGTVRNKAVYLALGVRRDGTKEVLGLWIEQTEGAKFWLRVMNELRHRGVEDVLIALVDGLKGFPEAINAVFPQARVQTCIVHLIRHSLDFASWKDRKHVAAALRPIYRAADIAAAQAELEAFDQGEWGRRYPAIAPAWRRQWPQEIPFLAYPLEVRRIIYTTNAIESLNSRLRRAVRMRGHFPSDEAATKLLFLVLREASKDWRMPPREWHAAKTQFANNGPSHKIPDTPDTHRHGAAARLGTVRPAS